jgi:hypothetical protein
MQAKFNETEKMKFRHTDLNYIIVKDGMQCVFPTVAIALHIFVILTITNYSAERFLSQLTRIKKPSENNNVSGQT